MFIRCMAIRLDNRSEQPNVIAIEAVDLEWVSLLPFNTISTFVTPQRPAMLDGLTITKEQLAPAPFLDTALTMFEGAEYYASHNSLNTEHHLKEKLGGDWINTDLAGRSALGAQQATEIINGIMQEFSITPKKATDMPDDAHQDAMVTAFYLGQIFRRSQFSLLELLEKGKSINEYLRS